jgi:tetratricopeptide (TPR) repeat protein/CHAT domain-containing protein
MLRKIWQWLKRMFRRLFSRRRQPGSRPSVASTPSTSNSQPLSNTELEYYFMQLLDGVEKGWNQIQVRRFFHAFRDRVSHEQWLSWLQNFGNQLLEAPVPNHELAHRLRKLARFSDPEIASVADRIGTQLLERELPAGQLETYFNQGMDKLEAGEYEAALQLFDQVLLYDSNHYRAWINRGNALGNLGQLEAAIASYERALELKDDVAAAWSNRGDALADLGRWQEAASSWQKSLDIRPNHAKTWFNRGIALGAHLGNWEEALHCWDRAAELTPNDVQIWFNRGIALSALARWEEALDSWQRVLQLNPNSREAWINKGVALQKLGRYEEAIEANNQAIGLHAAPSKTSSSHASVESLDVEVNANATQPTSTFLKGNSPSPSLEEAATQPVDELGETSGGEEEIDTVPPEDTPTVLSDSTTEVPPSSESPTAVSEKADSKSVAELVHEDPTAAWELAETQKYAAVQQILHGSTVGENERASYRNLQRLLDANTAAVSWYLGQENIIAFILKYNQQPIALEIPFSTTATTETIPDPWLESSSPTPHREPPVFHLQAWLREFFQGFAHRDTNQMHLWQKEMSDRLVHLSEILGINRLLAHLEEVNHLVLIPHQVLHLFPFDALFPDFAITQLPNAPTAEMLSERQVTEFSAFVGAESDSESVRYSEIETAAIAGMFSQSRRLSASECRASSVKSALADGGDIFHFASEFTHYPHQPMASGWQLSQGEFLSVGELLGEVASFPLVCLSACQLQLPELGMSAAESSEMGSDALMEWMGIANAFLARGSSYVLYGLWQVEEISTTLLVVRFYQLLLESTSPAEALQQAKQWLRTRTYGDLASWQLNLAQQLATTAPECSEELEIAADVARTRSNKMGSEYCPYAHPYYWAGFVLSGKV